jgi:hypothetical protein
LLDTVEWVPMSGFDLDLGVVEERMDDTGDGDSRVVLGVLDGSTPSSDWIDVVGSGAVLVLSIDGNLEELAADFAPEIKGFGGELMHFRSFLIVTPPGVGIDIDRL